MKCINCNSEIEKTYFQCLDNFIQTKYFDSEEENIFCSQECFCNYVQLEEMNEEDI